MCTEHDNTDPKVLTHALNTCLGQAKSIDVLHLHCVQHVPSMAMEAPRCSSTHPCSLMLYSPPFIHPLTHKNTHVMQAFCLMNVHPRTRARSRSAARPASLSSLSRVNSRSFARSTCSKCVTRAARVPISSFRALTWEKRQMQETDQQREHMNSVNTFKERRGQEAMPQEKV
eukprot:1144174-Pelagomonas_calceolata.AAC.4